MADDPKADQEWKEQARAEKERLAKELDSAAAEEKPADEKDAESGDESGGEDYALPPAEFMTLVTGLATQVIIALGEAPDPFSGKQHSRLDLARYNIDMLGMLEQKTEGNLSEGEAAALKTVLADLRMRYVQAASAKSGGQEG